MLGTYLNILKESLEKKIEALMSIEEIGNAQSELLKKESLDMEAFDRTVDEKDTYINELNKLDEGFETLYDKIKEELLEQKAQYAEQIKHLQELIGEITDKSVAIQAQESRNKALVEKHFTRERQELGKSRISSKAAYGYYKNMNKSTVVDSHFMDQKK